VRALECAHCLSASLLVVDSRNCGILVCSKCSAHRIHLSANKGGSVGKSEQQRVCDTCFDSASNTSAQNGALNADGTISEPSASPQPLSPVHHAEVSSHAVLADPNLSLPPLPSWCYAFGGAGSGVGEMVPLGRLYVRVICAVNLPAMNRIMSTTDPYCTLHCAGQSHKTRIVTNSLNPRFDQEFYFDVLSAREDQLTLMIYDWDQLGANKEVAYITIPLSEVSLSSICPQHCSCEMSCPPLSHRLACRVRSCSCRILIV
jgi:hypothetical protein